MWPFNRRNQSGDFDLTKLLMAHPKRTDLTLVRRWGCVNNLGISISQFNVYRKRDGYYITLQDNKGIESERFAHIVFGHCSTLMEAYMRATDMLSQLLYMSQLIRGKNQINLVVDTTPGRPVRRMATFRVVEERVLEERYPEFYSLVTDGNAADPGNTKGVDNPVRSWVVADYAGEQVAEFHVYGSGGCCQASGEWTTFYRRVGPIYTGSIEEAYEVVITDIAEVLDHSPLFPSLVIADLSMSTSAAYVLSTLTQTDNGIEEDRRYSPETLELYGQAQARLIRAAKNPEKP